MTKWKIYNQDVVEWAKGYNKVKFHALFCDPPYHLTTIVKRFGKQGSAPAKYGTDGVFARSSAGFMGQEWDGGDIAFQPKTWAAFHDVLYPGAFGMAFSASRNWHRLAVAIEDAGYIIHPTIFLWVQGQGFPKATNISKQIQPASEQKVVGSKLGKPGYSMTNAENQGNTLGWSKSKRDGKKETEILEPTDDMAKTWVGHRYGLQALKPAVEPIIVFQKPYDGKPLTNITETGAGALNIDDARIPTGEPVTINRFKDGAKPWGNGAGHEYETELTSQGRWPSNLILEEGSAQALDAQTGDLKSGVAIRHKSGGNTFGGDNPKPPMEDLGYSDKGGASRFFYVVQDKIDEADPAYYCGKVSKKERNAGLDDEEDKDFGASGGAQSKMKQGDEKYLQDSIGLNRIHKVKNAHPTLKPIDLSRYLATLLLPPQEYAPRRLLVPFSGVASEMIGAGLAGWDIIVGIENDTKNGYIQIAEKRLEHWLK